MVTRLGIPTEGGKIRLLLLHIILAFMNALYPQPKYFYVYDMINRINQSIMLDSFPMQGQCFT